MRARDNPFAAQHIDRLAYRLDGRSWRDLRARLERLGYRAAIVGPEGHGKTTLLEQLAAELPLAARWIRLNRGQRRPAVGQLREPPGGGELVLVDGAEQLSRWNWWRLRRWSRRAAGLLVTSHRPGLLPTLIECTTSPELLVELVRELTGSTEFDSLARRLFAHHRGNVREALRALYDHCATQAG